MYVMYLKKNMKRCSLPPGMYSESFLNKIKDHYLMCNISRTTKPSAGSYCSII